MRRVVLLASFVVPHWALGQTIYTWTDSRGTVHYTDDRSTVPPNVKVSTTEGEELSHMGPRPEVAAPAPPAGQYVQTPPGAAAPNPKSDEEYWRGLFKAAHEKIRGLEDELAIDEGRFSDPSRTPMGPNYYCAPGFYAPGFIGRSGFSGRPGFAPGFGVGSSQVVQGGVSGSLNVPLGSAGSLSVGGSAGSTVTRGSTTGGFSGVAPFVGYGGGLGYGGCIYQPYGDYAYNRERIDRTKAQLARAKEDLADLERRAANASVPLEWRR